MSVFAGIYRTNAWNGIESRSGPGSGPVATRRIAGAIEALVEVLGISSVLDVGCGDGYWMPGLPGYLGIDVAAEPLSLATARHPERRYELDEGGPLPSSDLVITRDVVQHLSLADGTALLGRILAARPRWLLASTYLGTVNHDVPTGSYCEPDLSAPPYSLGPPLLLVFDGWDWRAEDVIRDPRKFLGLWGAP